MAKILCSYSGIEFKCEHLPLSLTSRETAHPVFFLPQKKLLGLFSLYQDQKLTPTEEWLLFLAYLNSTELLEFRVPAKHTPETSSLIALHFEELVSICTKLQGIKDPRFSCAKIAITPTTSTLENLPHWIENWKACYTQFLKGQDDRKLLDSIQEIEGRLQRLTNAQSAKMQGKYNSTLAEWASKAFAFPDFLIEDKGKLITLSSYWKLIIRSCQSQERIFQFPKEDIEELRDHILDYIESAPKWGVDVLGIVEDGIELHKNFLGLGDLSYSFNGDSPTYRILQEDDSIQTANIEAIIQSAPREEPREENYPTRFAFLKAKMNWKLAQEHSAKGTPLSAANKGTV